MADFKNGDTITFRPGWRSQADVTAKVIGQDNGFLVTEDSTGFKRKVRAATARLAA